MDTAYRIYLGARNTGDRTFSPDDEARVEAILDEHFHGWTTFAGAGRWRGRDEEIRVITLSPRAAKKGANTAAASVETCARRLKEHLGQEAVMRELGGAVAFL